MQNKKTTFLHIAKQLLLIGAWAGLFFPMIAAAEVVPLAPLPTNFGGGTDTLPGYINTIFMTMIAVGAVLAVIRIIMGGFQYMTSEAVTQTKDSRAIITSAVGGLVLLLASWLILTVINPNLVQLDALKFTPLESLPTDARIQLGSTGSETYTFSEVLNERSFQTSKQAEAYAKACDKTGYTGSVTRRTVEFETSSEVSYVGRCNETRRYAAEKLTEGPNKGLNGFTNEEDRADYESFKSTCAAAGGTFDSPVLLEYNPQCNCKNFKYICVKK